MLQMFPQTERNNRSFLELPDKFFFLAINLLKAGKLTSDGKVFHIETRLNIQ
jgi:type VI protein secretion system component VasA